MRGPARGSSAHRFWKQPCRSGVYPRCMTLSRTCVRRRLVGLLFIVIGSLSAACGGASQNVVALPPTNVQASNQIIGTRAEGTAKELLAKGEQRAPRAALARGGRRVRSGARGRRRGRERSAGPLRSRVAYEGLGDREKARARYREVVRRFPNDPNARNALVREVSLDAYLEDWSALGEAAEMILARKEIDPAEKMLGLGARGLSQDPSGRRDRRDARDPTRPRADGRDALRRDRPAARRRRDDQVRER